MVSHRAALAPTPGEPAWFSEGPQAAEIDRGTRVWRTLRPAEWDVYEPSRSWISLTLLDQAQQ